MFSCSVKKPLHITNQQTTVMYDSTHIKFTGDSLNRDTVKYKKQVINSTRAPYILEGKWYIVAATIIGFIAAFLWIKK